MIDAINALKTGVAGDTPSSLLGEFDPGDLQVLQAILPLLKGILSGEYYGPNGKGPCQQVLREMTLDEIGFGDGDSSSLSFFRLFDPSAPPHLRSDKGV